MVGEGMWGRQHPKQPVQPGGSGMGQEWECDQHPLAPGQKDWGPLFIYLFIVLAALGVHTGLL